MASAASWEQDFPRAIVDERAVLGIALRFPDKFSFIAAQLDAGDFIEEGHSVIFQTMASLYENQTSWAWTTIADIINEQPTRPAALEFASSFVAEIAAEGAEVDKLQLYVDHVLEIKKRRAVVQAAVDMSRLAKDPTKNLEVIYSKVQKVDDLFSAAGVGLGIRRVNQSNIWDEFKEDMVRMYNTPFLGTGYPTLDDKLAWGLTRGVSIICGRPSMGKSVLRANIQRKLAEQGIGTIVVNREQSMFQEIGRLICMQAGMSMMDFIRVREWVDNRPDLQEKIFEGIKYWKENWPIEIVEPMSQFLVKDIKREVELARKEGRDPRVVFVDLFAQLDDVSVSDNQAAVIQRKMNEVGQLAKILDIHISLVVQIKRIGAGTGVSTGKIDFLELLKGSGGQEERADLVLMPFRPAYYKPDEYEDNRMYVMCLKQRDGERQFTVPLKYEKEHLRIEELPPEEASRDKKGRTVEEDMSSEVMGADSPF